MDISARHTCPSCGAQSTVALTVTPHPTGTDDEPTAPDATEQPKGNAAPPALADAARRRSAEAEQRVVAYYADHPGAPVKRAARDLGVAPETVRKYRPNTDTEEG